MTCLYWAAFASSFDGLEADRVYANFNPSQIQTRSGFGCSILWSIYMLINEKAFIYLYLYLKTYSFPLECLISLLNQRIMVLKNQNILNPSEANQTQGWQRRVWLGLGMNLHQPIAIAINTNQYPNQYCFNQSKIFHFPYDFEHIIVYSLCIYQNRNPMREQGNLCQTLFLQSGQYSYILTS